MNYNELNLEKEINNVVTAVEQGDFRQATKKESMTVRLAALSEIVYEMKKKVESDKELVNA